MEQQKRRKWHLVRNNNGEWICSEQAVYLDDFSTMIYNLRAKKYDLPLSPQTDCAGEKWYYKHEVEAVMAAMEADRQEIKPRKLKITPVKREFNEKETKEINAIIMNMFKPNKNGSFDTLNEKYRLWQELENNPPRWWKNVLADKELYVEIRKDNYANIYYYGGNVALIRWTGKEITAKTHQKYLGDKKPVRIVPQKENGKETDKTVRIYEYRDCREKLQTPKGLEGIKHYIRETYHDIHGENTQKETREERDRNRHVYASNEKSVQGALKLRFPERYIDSEFAYQRPGLGNERKTIRFDLVELRGKELVFIELKLITDPRLRTGKGEAEIIGQMKKYAEFIREHAEDFKTYYTKVLRIKKRLGLWNGETEIDSVSLKPELLVVNTYKEDKMSDKKEKRIKAIKALEERPEFETSIEEYQDLCK